MDQVTLMDYNLLNYPAGNPITADTALRNPYFRTTVSAVNPDVLVVEEMQSQAGVDGFLSNVLNTASSGYSAGVFINGTTDTENAIFYKHAKFQFISNIPIKTALRDINEFKLVHKLSGDTVRIYAVHLKASNTASDETKRGAEVDSLRKVTNKLPVGSDFIVCGDFNIYKSSETAYQKILHINTTDQGYFIDPITLSGTWNNSAYAIHLTQSPRTRAFGGGSTGGMDDRFDMILYSNAISQPGGMSYVANSEIVLGNDGQHFNDSINKMPNNAVTQAVANAIHYGSDHIPVLAKFNFEYTPAVSPVTLNLKVFIQGYYAGNGQMQSVLFNNGLSTDFTACDSISIEVRDTISPYNLIATGNTLLHTNGMASISFSNLASNRSYYLAIRCRNAVEIWSKNKIFLNPSFAGLDFTR